MSIDRNIVAQSVSALSSVESIQMDPSALAEDAAYLTLAFPDQPEYQAAVANTVKALKDIARNRVSTDSLEGTYQGWESYHYQPKVGQNIAADMRIIFKRKSDSVHVLAFGHRYIPSDIYRRASTVLRARMF